jgi:hypothetical protein
MLAAYAAQPGAVVVLGVNVRDQPASALGLLADLGVHYRRSPIRTVPCNTR